MTGVDPNAGKQNDGDKKTTILYAWLGVDDTGREGIISAPLVGPFGTTPTPYALVSTSYEMVMKFRPTVESIVAARKKPIRLGRFEQTGTAEVIRPTTV